MIRTLAACAAFCAAILPVAAAHAAPSDAGVSAGPFTLSAQPPATAQRGVILVIDADTGCAEAQAAAQAALAEQDGRATGVVAADAACGAAANLAAHSPGDGLELAFADRAEALGDGADPNRWLSARRDRGVYVWDMAAYRRLDFAGPRQVLGVFEAGQDRPAPNLAEMTEAALEALSRHRGGYFLLVQAGELDDAARAALERAAGDGAVVIAADGPANRRAALDGR